MVYNPSTDFVALWRAVTGGARRAQMPALDFLVAALERSGVLHVQTSNAQPTTNQAKTAWFRPAIPTYSAEGTLYLWDAGASAYVEATPALFNAYLNAS